MEEIGGVISAIYASRLLAIFNAFDIPAAFKRIHGGTLSLALRLVVYHSRHNA